MKLRPSYNYHKCNVVFFHSSYYSRAPPSATNPSIVTDKSTTISKTNNTAENKEVDEDILLFRNSSLSQLLVAEEELATSFKSSIQTQLEDIQAQPSNTQTQTQTQTQTPQSQHTDTDTTTPQPLLKTQHWLECQAQ